MRCALTNPQEQLFAYMRSLISLNVLMKEGVGLVMHRLSAHVTSDSLLKTATCLFPA